MEKIDDVDEREVDGDGTEEEEDDDDDDDEAEARVKVIILPPDDVPQPGRALHSEEKIVLT